MWPRGQMRLFTHTSCPSLMLLTHTHTSTLQGISVKQGAVTSSRLPAFSPDHGADAVSSHSTLGINQSCYESRQRVRACGSACACTSGSWSRQGGANIYSFLQGPGRWRDYDFPCLSFSTSSVYFPVSICLFQSEALNGSELCSRWLAG